MTSNAESSPDPSDLEIVLSRVFSAPRDLVWQAWTDPKHVARWWGPKGFTTTIETMDVRPGGQWIQVMHGPDGMNYPNTSVFTEVQKPERIVFSHGGGREGGPGVHFTSTWSFEALATESTRVTIRMVFSTAADRDRVVRDFGAIEGGKQTLERLGELLDALLAGPAEREVVITRIFDAPRDLVFRAWTDPVHLARWWGPTGFTNPVSEADARPGGAWRIVMRGPNGTEYPCEGVYREVVPLEKLVFTNNAVDSRGLVLLEGVTTVIFQDLGPRTKLTLRTRAVAVEPLARAFLTGMEAGWTQSIDKLGSLVSNERPAN